MTDPAPPVTRPAAEPDDADEMRGFHFRRLLRRPLTWIALGLAVAVAAAGGGIFIGTLFIALGALAAVVIVALFVFAIADSAAQASFFEAYAQQRSLERSGRGALPPATPLLQKGDDRYGSEILRGPLAAGLAGTLALYTYETHHTDRDGHRQTDYHRFTIGICEVPACAQRVPVLYAQRKFGPRALEGVEDAFREVERVQFESEALAERYEIFVSPQQDAGWLRRLFSPTFIVWLA